MEIVKDTGKVAFIKMNKNSIQKLEHFIDKMNPSYKNKENLISLPEATIYGILIRESIVCPEHIAWFCNEKGEIIYFVNLREFMGKEKDIAPPQSSPRNPGSPRIQSVMAREDSQAQNASQTGREEE